MAAAKKVERWKKLDDELSKIIKESGLDKYKKQDNVPTFRPSFKKSISKFIKLYFPPDLSFSKFLSRLAFAKDHDDMNDICLNYAYYAVILARNDTSNDVPSPVDTFPKECFFPQTKKSKESEEHGTDYQVPSNNCIRLTFNNNQRFADIYFIFLFTKEVRAMHTSLNFVHTKKSYLV